jgi:hypothetical protein
VALHTGRTTPRASLKVMAPDRAASAQADYLARIHTGTKVQSTNSEALAISATQYAYDLRSLEAGLKSEASSIGGP